MIRLCSCVFVFLNVLTFSLGLVIIAALQHYHLNSPEQCLQVFKNPLTAMGVLFFCVSLMGMVGTYFKLPSLLWIYSLVTFLSVLVLFGALIFGILVAKLEGTAATAPKYKAEVAVDYRIIDYSKWLQHHITDDKYWVGVRGCLASTNVCKSILAHDQPELPDYCRIKHSAMETLCCKPPTKCGFEYKNATYWEVPKSSNATRLDGDCKAWRNEADKLCYDCNACKAGVLDEIRSEWLIFVKVVAIYIAIILIISCVSCITVKNMQSQLNKYKHNNTG